MNKRKQILFAALRMSLNIIGEFLHHPIDTTCQFVHDWTQQKNSNIGKDGFHACVDVSHFKPSEVSVKTVDNTVVVEAKHNKRDDENGSVERHLIHKYVLPSDYDVKTLNSALSSDGVLTIKAPVPIVIEGEDKHFSIAQTNVPVHFSGENKQFEDPAPILSMIACAWPEY